MNDFILKILLLLILNVSFALAQNLDSDLDEGQLIRVTIPGVMENIGIFDQAIIDELFKMENSPILSKEKMNSRDISVHFDKTIDCFYFTGKGVTHTNGKSKFGKVSSNICIGDEIKLLLDNGEKISLFFESVLMDKGIKKHPDTGFFLKFHDLYGEAKYMLSQSIGVILRAYKSGKVYIREEQEVKRTFGIINKKKTARSITTALERKAETACERLGGLYVTNSHEIIVKPYKSYTEILNQRYTGVSEVECDFH